MIPITKLYVVADRSRGEISNADRDVYTLSFDPERLGWETDSGYPGYGLSKEVAEAIAGNWNKQI